MPGNNTKRNRKRKAAKRSKAFRQRKKAAGKLVASGPRARPGIHGEGKSPANSNVFKSGQRSEEKGLKPLPTREKIMPPRRNSEFGKKTIPKATPVITSAPKNANTR